MVAPGGAYALTVAPDNPGRILFGAAGGVYLSRDGGLHWQRRLALPNSAGAAFAWQPGSSRVVFAGAVAGAPRGSIDVFVSRDAGSTWHVFGHDLKSLSGIMSLHVTAGEDVYAGTMGNATWTASLTRGAWRKVAAGMPGSGDHVASIAGVPGHSRTLFVGTLGFGVFRTTDGGRHWVNLSRGLSKAHNAWIVLSVVYAPLQHALFAGTADGVYELKLS
jgi:photosystem II stability/assembly factor-like uncharacterized protein